MSFAFVSFLIYSIFEVDVVKYVSFIDGKDNYQEFQISNELYDVFNKYKLVDLSCLNAWDRHIELPEIWEDNLHKRAFVELKAVDEDVIENLQNKNCIEQFVIYLIYKDVE